LCRSIGRRFIAFFCEWGRAPVYYCPVTEPLSMANDIHLDLAQQEAYHRAARQLQNGRSIHTAVSTLVSAGVSERDATDFVIAASKRITDTRRKHAGKNILYGSLWCGGGLVLTMVTYGMASGGVSYVVALGMIIFGAIQLFRGLTHRN
jgi:hypothetical protein